MKSLVALVTIVAFVVAKPLESGNGPRRYFPEEEDEFRIKSFVWQDEDGNYRLETLTGARAGRKASIDDVTFYLYTQKNPTDGEVIKPTDFESMAQSKFYKKGRANIFIAHGWNGGYKHQVNTLITEAILNGHDMNVFVVDWNGPANKDYLTAKAAVTVVGDVVGSFITEMISHFGISSKSFNLIGHSLGAHIVGCAGARVEGKVNYIIGLDPAGPLFNLSNTENRLDPTDGDFVQVVHTNGGFLAFSSSIGHADFFPNGGSKQPGCGLDLIGTCAHSRSYIYLAESINNPGFIGHLCDSQSSFVDGKCENNQRSLLGTLEVDKEASGDYFLSTNTKKPFALY